MIVYKIMKYKMFIISNNNPEKPKCIFVSKTLNESMFNIQIFDEKNE